MRRERLLLTLGVWVAVLPYLGFPHSWKNLFFTLTGLGLMYVAYTIYHENKIVETIEETFDNFSENKDWDDNNTGETLIIETQEESANTN